MSTFQIYTYSELYRVEKFKRIWDVKIAKINSLAIYMIEKKVLISLSQQIQQDMQIFNKTPFNYTDLSQYIGT